jgi:hypothetical protein
MTLKNRLYNLFHHVKRYRAKGCKNCASVGSLYNIPFVTKYDWSKPFTFFSKKMELDEKIWSISLAEETILKNREELISENARLNKKYHIIKYKPIKGSKPNLKGTQPWVFPMTVRDRKGDIIECLK